MRGAVLRPNPTNGVAQIVFRELPASDMQVIVADAAGRVVKTLPTTQQAVVRLDCSELPGGIYMVHFRSGAESGVRRLAVVK